MIVAKLDRLARNVAFLSSLMESGVDFVCCDMPQANRMTVHILAAVAEGEAAAISHRTKAARFPVAVKAILEKGLALRERYQKQEISTHGLWTATGRLEVELDRRLSRTYQDSANRRLAKHLRRERPYLFTFLYCPGLDATNNGAERALRPLVVARKNWGGNRTAKGARAQAVLSSILGSAQQQGKNSLDVLIELLVTPDKSQILALVPPTCRTQARFSAALAETVLPARSRSPSRGEGTVPVELAWHVLPCEMDSASAAILRAKLLTYPLGISSSPSSSSKNSVTASLRPRDGGGIHGGSSAAGTTAFKSASGASATPRTR